MNYKIFKKNLIINLLIIFGFLYGVILYISKNLNREKSIFYKIKNKKNIDELVHQLKKFNVNKDSTTHFYNDKLPINIKKKINIIDNEILNLLGPEYSSIPQINEVYYNAKKTSNSDKSFTNLHTDSPFNFCQTYRVLVCIEPDNNVITIIPIDNINISLKKYETLGFDYANTLHYITINENNIKKNRIVLKLHYGKTDICRKITKRYTRWARTLFVNNLNSMKLTGKLMLISQFLSTYLLYILVSMLILIIIYFKSKKQNNLLMYFLFFIVFGLALYNILFQSYFLVNDF